MRRHGFARSRKLEPVIPFAGTVGIECRASLGRFGNMTGDKFCADIRKERRKIDMQLSRNVFNRRRSSTERGVVLIQELVIKTSAQQFPGTLLDFTDVDEHPVARVDWPGENKIRHVIAASAVIRHSFRTESGEIIPVAPMLDPQAPRCRELETFADRQQHEAANTLEMVSQIAPAIFSGGSGSPSAMARAMRLRKTLASRPEVAIHPGMTPA